MVLMSGDFFENIKETLKGYYFSAEDRWYRFTDWLADKVPPIGNLVDAIEDKGVPTFPLAVLIVFLLIILIGFMFLGTGSTLTVNVTDLQGNHIEGATVIVYFEGDEKDSRVTNIDGVAKFYLPNETYSVKIQKDNFEIKLETLILNGNREIGYQLSPEDVGVTKVVRLASASGELISGSGSIKYSCEETGETHTTTYSGGAFNATFSSECETIKVESVSGYTIVEGRISFSGSYNTVEVEKLVVNTGTVIVNFDNNAPAGLKVMIKSNDLANDLQKYNSSGSVIFEEVPTNTYYVIVTDPSGNHADYDSRTLGEVKELAKDETITFNVTLQKSNSAEINILVKDVSDGAPLPGTSVRLISNNTTMNTEMTGSSGQVTFNVPADTTYTIEADHPNYIIAKKVNVSSATPNVEINLVRATEQNSQSLAVKVSDASKQPINNVKVYLKKIDDTAVGDYKSTGADGQVEFFNLEIGTYYVYAVKDGFDGVNSASVQVIPRQQSVLEVTLPIGNGEIKILALDPERNALSGASVKVFDYYTNQLIEQGTTVSDGTKSFYIRADKVVYFEVSMPNYMTYFTAAITPDEKSVIEREIVFIRETGTLSAQIMGVYNGGQRLSDSERSVSEGIYTARVLVVVPKGSFSEAGLHLRTGAAEQGKTNYMEEDPSYIGAVHTSAGSTKRGTTYSPPNGNDVDSKNLTSGNSKWVNAVWKNPKEGAYETEIELVVTDAQPGSSINLWYRSWAKGSSVLRYPSDVPTQELYAQANNYLLSAGAASLCKDSFCKTYAIETLTGSNAGRKQFITSTFSAKQDTTYRLTFSLTNYSGKTLGDSVLNISSSGVSVDEITVNGIEKESPVSLGSLVADSYTQGTVEFTASSAGSGNLTLIVNSSSKTEMEDVITMSVQGNKTMTVDFVPKEIIPYVDNSMFFEISDNNVPLSNVLITIYSGGEAIGTVKTNAEGMAIYELESPSAGETIKITAEKEGYNLYTTEKTVDKEILTIIPPEITNTIKIGELVSITEQIVAENWTVKDLTVKAVSFSGDLSTYLTITTDNVVGQVINPEEDLNFNLTIKLNNTGKNLVEPKTVEGRLIIDVEVKDVKSTFTNQVPIKIRISRPGYIDSANCLKVTPGDVEFITSTKEATQTLTIKNTCTAEGINISLSDLEAKISQNAAHGTLTVSGSEFNSIQLGEAYSSLGSLVEANLEETLTLKFTPKISSASGKQDVVVTFRAKNVPEEESEEEITTNVNVSMTMSNLSECLEIEKPSGGVTLDVAGWNLGYNRIINSNMSSHMSNYQGFSQQNSYGYGGSMPYGMQSAIPFMGSGNATGSLAYEQDSFTIKNNCNVEVEIDLDPASELNVDEEKFTISPDDDHTVQVSPGYTLGKYKVKVNAKLANTEDTKQNIGSVDVLVRRLGDVDTDCIKVNVTLLQFNSFLYKEKIYKAYNYCYDTGVQLSRSNSAVTLQCEAPQTTMPNQQSEAYFTVGQEQYYQNAYPTSQIGGLYNSYYDYLNPNNECGRNSCHMVSSISVRNRSTMGGGTTGTIEVIDFEVRPSTAYIAQRKLFDQQNTQHGLFSSLGAIRDWATQTDARTRVYGELGVQYTNQYGSVQCMTFPVQVEDQWRIGESIDSAINYGDPNAHPSECVNENALDLISFYEKRTPQYKGAIPNGTGWQGGIKFIHIAEPPAVRVGPPQTVTTRQKTTQDTDKGTATANCGYLDSLSNIQLTGPNEIDGVKIKVEGTTSGSILKNSRGPNLMVEIDRTGMSKDCVIIETSVKARLRRVNNFEAADVYWPLKVMVIKEGVDPTTINKADCAKTTTQEATEQEECRRKIMAELAANPNISYNDLMAKVGKNCEKYFTQQSVESLKEETATQTGTCTTNAKSFGFEKINVDRINSKEVQNNLANILDCTTYFCTHDQLQIFLLEQYRLIDEKLIQENLSPCNGTKNLSELYKEAGTFDVNMCDGTKISEVKKFFTGADGVAVSQAYTLNATQTQNKIPTMITLLSGITDESILVKFNVKTGTSASEFNTMFEQIGAAKDVSGRHYYIPVQNYKLLIETANNTEACKRTGADCDITGPCGKPVRLLNKAFEWLAKEEAGLTIINGVVSETQDTNEIELVYNANPKLNAIHDLAVFDSDLKSGVHEDLLLTQMSFNETNTTAFRTWAASFTLQSGGQSLKEFIVDDEKELAFENATANVGQYKAQIDFNYCNAENNVADITDLIKRSAVTDAENAEKNILLKRAFVTTPQRGAAAVSSAGTIIDSQGKFYETVPVKLTVTPIAGEKALIYSPLIGNPQTLIKWRNSSGAIVTTDSRDPTAIRNANPNADTTYLIASLNPSATAQTLNGIYYYTQGANLRVAAGQKTQTYNATYVGGATGTINPKTVSGGTNNIAVIEIPSSAVPTLKDIVEKVKSGIACISEDGSNITWNETELLK